MKLLSKRNRRKNMKGVTAVELVLAATILTIGFMPISKMMSKINRSVEDREVKVRAVHLGKNLLVEIRSNRWDEKTPLDGSEIPAGSPTTKFGLHDAGENTPADFDDIDDFDGYWDIPQEGYRRDVAVSYVNAPLGGGLSPAGGSTDFKRIQVFVTHTGSNGISETIEGVECNGI